MVKIIKKPRHRSSVTGQAVTKEFADANPDTTIAETVAKSSKKVAALLTECLSILRQLKFEGTVSATRMDDAIEELEKTVGE